MTDSTIDSHHTTASEDTKILVVVVEAHNHVCEHIHYILRQRRLFQPWTMLHYDAHPDLSCPHEAIPAIACFRPSQEWYTGKNLYELLDSTTSGISEWILPLVLAANLEQIIWVRPGRQSIEQLPIGNQVYHVGAWLPTDHSSKKTKPSHFLDLPVDAAIKVDWNTNYYVDDGAVVSTEELIMPQPLQLTVLENDTLPNVHQPYLIDVCLDFFQCCNPFLKDVEVLSPAVAQTFQALMLESTLYQAGSFRDPTLLSSFRKFLVDYLGQCVTLTSGLNDVPPISHDLHTLSRYYSSPENGRNHLENLKHLLYSYGRDTRKNLCQQIEEAIPNIGMPHSNNADAVQERERSLLLFQSGLKSLVGAPFLITVARSAQDGFTPLQQVEFLQRQVLQAIHDKFCGCSNPRLHPDLPLPHSCKLRVTFDYGSWEGSQLDFLQSTGTTEPTN